MGYQSKTQDCQNHVHSRSADGHAERFEQLRSLSPALYNCIDFDRVLGKDYSLVMEKIADICDFDSTSRGGRGDFYNHAQRNPLVRVSGIRQLFNLISPNNDLMTLSPKHKILDVLGGDGVLTRALQHLVPSSLMPNILTSDLSEDMVAAAQAHGLPALCQPAQYLLLKDGCLDGVIIAYGTHHIPQAERLKVCEEAFRVLKPGGKVVLHDFEEGSPAALWFSQVVDRYSLTGHDFPHFTSEEIRQSLLEVGFTGVYVENLYDPYTLYGDSPEQVQNKLGEYLYNMYGLVKLLNVYSNLQAAKLAYTLACNCFRYDYEHMGLNKSFGASQVCIFESSGHWHIEMPRVALVGFATKSS